MELTSKEKKFLANPKLMRKAFGIYAEQATIVYEYMRKLDEKPELFERFKNVHLSIDSKLKASKFGSRALTEPRITSKGQKSKITLFAQMLNPYITENNEILKEQALARYKFFNSHIANLSSRRYKTFDEVTRKKTRQVTPEERVTLYRNIRTSSANDLIRLHKTIYHEFVHSLSKYTSVVTSQNATDFGKSSQSNTDAKQKIFFIGVDPVYGYEIKKDGKRGGMLWKSVGLQYLNEGVAENVATECAYNEALFSDNPLYKSLDKDTLKHQFVLSSGYFMPICLAGMWNSVSNDELTKQSLGEKSKDSDLLEATQIFKGAFCELMEYISGNAYNPRTQSMFTEQKIDKILDKYGKCIGLCESCLNGALLEDKMSSYDLERFEFYHKEAIDPNNVLQYISNFVATTIQEEYLMATKVGEFCFKNWPQQFNQSQEFNNQQIAEPEQDIQTQEVEKDLQQIEQDEKIDKTLGNTTEEQIEQLQNEQKNIITVSNEIDIGSKDIYQDEVMVR